MDKLLSKLIFTCLVTNLNIILHKGEHGFVASLTFLRTWGRGEGWQSFRGWGLVQFPVHVFDYFANINHFR